MNKVRELLKNKVVITGVVTAVIVLTGMVVEPSVVEAIVNAITGLVI